MRTHYFLNDLDGTDPFLLDLDAIVRVVMRPNAHGMTIAELATGATIVVPCVPHELVELLHAGSNQKPAEQVSAAAAYEAPFLASVELDAAEEETAAESDPGLYPDLIQTPDGNWIDKASGMMVAPPTTTS